MTELDGGPKNGAMATSAPVWEPYWPKRFRATWFIVFVVTAAVCITTAWNAINALIERHWATGIFGAFNLVCQVVIAAAALSASGIYSARVAKSVATTDVEPHGKGLVVPQKAHVKCAIFAVGAAGWLGTASVVGFLGISESVLGERRGITNSPALSGAAAAFVIACLIAQRFGTRNAMILHSEGITRRTRRWAKFQFEYTDLLMRWDDIDDLVAETDERSAVIFTVRLPYIRIVAPDALDPERPLRPREDASSTVFFTVALEADPNALISLVAWCRANPEAREQLQRSDARELLEAPALMSRLRLSHAATARKYWWFLW